MSVSILIAGDVVPPEGNKSNESVFEAFRPYLTQSDFATVNLEAPVVSCNSVPIRKSGPNISTGPSIIQALKSIGFDVVTLANNHFFDYGQGGVDSTVEACNSVGISYVGGGRTSEEARKPLYLSRNDIRVAIINVCEQEYSIADSEHGGSNPMDLIQLHENISEARQKSDYVIVIAHGGVENFQYPTPGMKRQYRHFIDLGADAVVNHHQHCVCGYEVYKENPIFYGLGNFYFPLREGMVSRKTWDYGYAVRLSLGESIDFELIPYKQGEEGISLIDKEDFNKEMDLLNLPVRDDFLLQEKFDEYLLGKEYELKAALLPSALQKGLLSAAIRRGMLGKIYSGDSLYSLKNRLSCESHHEALKRLFTILTK